MWASVQINEVFLKYLSHHGDLFSRFTIKDVQITEGDFKILQSEYSFGVTPTKGNRLKIKPTLDLIIPHHHDRLMKKLQMRRAHVCIYFTADQTRSKGDNS
jgi:hypothetical protein